MKAAHLHGIVTLVQERRFQLVDDDAVAHLLILAHDAPLDETALEALQRSGRRVTITTKPDQSLIASVATDIAYVCDITSIAEESANEATTEDDGRARSRFS